MTAMDPAVPTQPSTAWTLFILSVAALAVIAIFLCNWRRTKPAPAPPPVDTAKAITDGFNTHAETAAALTIPNLDPWLPTRVDPEDDIDGVLVEPPEWLALNVVFAAILTPDDRDAYLDIAAHLLSDPDFTNRIDHILELH